MAKDKVTINTEHLDVARAAAENANVKIVTETAMNADTILTLRFRQPANLFFMGCFYRELMREKTQAQLPWIKAPVKKLSTKRVKGKARQTMV